MMQWLFGDVKAEDERIRAAHIRRIEWPRAYQRAYQRANTSVRSDQYSAIYNSGAKEGSTEELYFLIRAMVASCSDKVGLQLRVRASCPTELVFVPVQWCRRAWLYGQRKVCKITETVVPDPVPYISCTTGVQMHGRR